MADIVLAAETGRRPGSGAARRLRAAGKVPAVVYGHGRPPLPVAVDARELRAALTTNAGRNALLDLRVDGDSHLTLAREIQRHPLRHTVVHVDFLVVGRDEVVAAEVPLTMVGDAEAVRRGDGLVDQQLFMLAVRATPAAIPAAVEVDVSALEIGAALRVGDLALPPGVSTEVDPETAVVVGVAPRVAEAAEAAEAGDAAGGTAAPPAGAAGEAPAGGGEG